MKKFVSACLIASMLAVPCVSVASADDSTFLPVTNITSQEVGSATLTGDKSLLDIIKDECLDVSLCKPIYSVGKHFKDHHIVDSALLLTFLTLAHKAKKKIDNAVFPRFAAGYTHKQSEVGESYKPPVVDYTIDTSKPQFNACPFSDKNGNVYYSSVGKFTLKLNDDQKKNFSDNGYISVKLRKAPQKNTGKFKKPLIWAYSKLTGRPLPNYNLFYLHGPDLATPTLWDYLKQFLPFLDAKSVSLTDYIASKLPWVEKDFVKLNYGIVLTNKDEENVLNFKAPTTADYTKEYQDKIKLMDDRKRVHPRDDLEEFDTVEAWASSATGKKKYIYRKNIVHDKKFYTPDEITKLKIDNAKKKEIVLNKLANASHEDYLTQGEIARLSLQHPEQPFRLVINNANGTLDADKLSLLLSRTDEPINIVKDNPSLLFDFEYVLPLPQRLKVASKSTQPNAAKVIEESKSIEKVTQNINIKKYVEKAKDKIKIYAERYAGKTKNAFGLLKDKISKMRNARNAGQDVEDNDAENHDNINDQDNEGNGNDAENQGINDHADEDNGNDAENQGINDHADEDNGNEGNNDEQHDDNAEQANVNININNNDN